MGGLVEQLGAHQEDQRQAIVGREERVREAAEKAEQLRWRVREEERERGEREKELEASRDMERSLRYCAMHQDVIQHHTTGNCQGRKRLLQNVTKLI